MDRVCFGGYKHCERFLDFKTLSELDDEDYSQDFIGADTGETGGEEAGAIESQDKKYCGACALQPADCVLVPCGHQYFCMSCYKEWNKVDPTLYNYMDEDGNIPEEIRRDFGDAPTPTLCPICRRVVQTAVKPIST